VPNEISLAATGDTFRRHLSPSLLMGSSPIVVSGSSGTRNRPNNKSKNDPCVSSSGFVYLLVSFVALGSIAGIYVRFMMTPNVHASISSIGCKEDDEGSWSIGVFYGDSPFSLKPIEDVSFLFLFSYCMICSSVCYFTEFWVNGVLFWLMVMLTACSCWVSFWLRFQFCTVLCLKFESFEILG